MGYVASRKFCCCLPVRFGVFCMSLLGLASGGAISTLGWIEVHKQMTHQLDLDTREQVALWFLCISWSFMTLISLLGFLGCIFKIRSWIVTYAYTVTINTFVNITFGIFFIWTLFHRDDNAVDKCVNGANGEVGDIKHWFCQKGFDVIRIVIVIIFVIVWLFQIAGIFIVFDYVGQLHDEYEMEEDEEDKKFRRQQPPTAIVVNAAPDAPAMRTTYDANPYPAEQGGWTSSKSPYAFNMQRNAYGNA